MVNRAVFSIGFACVGLGCGSDRAGGDGTASASAEESGITVTKGDMVTATEGDDDEADGNDDDPIFDISLSDLAGNGGDCPSGGMMGDDVEFSFIWIANSPTGTVA